MKKIYFTIIGILINILVTNAQWTTNGSNISNSNSGNVGIGTTTPAAPLDINGALAMKGTVIRDEQFISVNTDGTYVVASGSRLVGTYTLNFEASNRVQTVVLLSNATQYDLAGNLTVLANKSYSSTPVMTNFRLAWSQDGSVVYLIFDITNRVNGNLVKVHFDGIGSYGPSWGGTLPASFNAGGVYPFTINNGNIGIGTANPSANLEVSTNAQIGIKGDANNSALTLLKNVNQWGVGYPVLILKCTSSSNNSYPNPVSDIGILQITGFNKSAANKSINSNDNFFVFTNGTVGINTNDTKGYQLAVNGSAIATSMTVKLQTNWPDYVFTPTYTLPTLGEVKTYIDQNHHLPEIPSEEEVLKNGINLGEMNKLLIKKVEELTLYLIEKDKKEKEQEKLNQALLNKLNAIELKLQKINLYDN